MKPSCTCNWPTSEGLPGRMFIPLHRSTEVLAQGKAKGDRQKPTSTAFLPFVQKLPKHIYNVLAQYNSGNIHLLTLERHSILRWAMGSLGLKAPAVCKIMCKCRAIYMSKMSCMIRERKEKRQVHQTDLELHHLWQGIQTSKTLDTLRTQWY